MGNQGQTQSNVLSQFSELEQVVEKIQSNNEASLHSLSVIIKNKDSFKRRNRR